MEFYQFHPTALSAEGGFLISEAVRGDGAVLRAQDGTRFMQAVHPDAELAPRDVVARGIARQMRLQGGMPVLLDATALGAAFLADRFPTIDAACRRAGLDWARFPVPVAPAAHYWMGGIRTDTWGRTSVPGLFAVGEVACTGVHGANRLASNSLLESLVFAWRSAQLLLDSPTRLPSAASFTADPSGTLLDLADPLEASEALPSRGALQALLWDTAGIERNRTDLRAALAQLRRWKVHEVSITGRETANLLLLGEALVTAALAREESRGAHFRTDFPLPADALRHHLSVAKAVSLPC